MICDMIIIMISVFQKNGLFTLLVCYFFKQLKYWKEWTLNISCQKSWQKFTYPHSTLNQSAYWLKKNASDALHPQNSGVIGWSHLHCWWHSVFELLLKYFVFMFKKCQRWVLLVQCFLHILTLYGMMLESKKNAHL